MDDVKSWLQYSFQTSNLFTLAVSSTGHAAMEAAVATIVERGDIVMVGVNGVWGERMCILANRFGADVRNLSIPAGTTFTVEEIEAALTANPGTKIVFLVHGGPAPELCSP